MYYICINKENTYPQLDIKKVEEYLENRGYVELVVDGIINIYYEESDVYQMLLESSQSNVSVVLRHKHLSKWELEETYLERYQHDINRLKSVRAKLLKSHYRVNYEDEKLLFLKQNKRKLQDLLDRLED